MRVTRSKTLTRVTRLTIFHWPTLGNVQIEFTPPWLLFFFGSKSFQASGSARRFFSVLFMSSRSLPISFNKQIPSQAAISLKQLGSSSSLRPLHLSEKETSESESATCRKVQTQPAGKSCKCNKIPSLSHSSAAMALAQRGKILKDMGKGLLKEGAKSGTGPCSPPSSASAFQALDHWAHLRCQSLPISRGGHGTGG